MGKAPAFQFYVKDWLSDTQLRLASASTKGIWIDLLCYMWGAPERGKLELSDENLMKLTGAKKHEIELFFDEAKKLSFCDISVTDNGLSQIYNRRMYRESKAKENNRLRQKKYREKKRRNAEITPPSPSPSPSPTPSPRKKGFFSLPDWIDKNLWSEYKKYRQNGKTKFTPYAQKLAIQKLEKLKTDGEDPNEVIKQTIQCGWSGLFPVKESPKSPKKDITAWRKRISNQQ